MNAIAAAGDFTYRADKREVMITGAADGVERKVQLTPTTPVRPGDRIRVKERLF
jgi:polysaccharide export outer membrane protein